MKDVVVCLAGSSWDGVAGTDKNLALALASDGPILWVDPPVSIHRSAHTRWPVKLESVAPGIRRLRTFGPPGVTKPVIRRWTERWYRSQVKAAVLAWGLPVGGSVCASPIMTFCQDVEGARVLFVTDDWMSGASLMGFSHRHIRRVLKSNATVSTAIVAVSGYLANLLVKELGHDVGVVHNGCNIPERPAAVNSEKAQAVLIGQLNERLDFDVLETVARTGIHIAVAGPKTSKVPAVISRLDGFLSLPNVHWHGTLGGDELACLLAHSNVGLTPYADTPFNRSSFPLKTLEYIAAGVPVVSTDLPASQFDPAARVTTVSSAAEFALAVTEISKKWPSEAEREAQAKLAINHSWLDRARLMRTMLES